MKKINWVIDKYLFDEYEDRLSTAIQNSGANVYFYDDICGKTFKEWILEKFTQDDIVVFHGSLQHGRQLTQLPIYPGVFMTIDNYECYKYYGYYGEKLLNSEYLMMGLNDVVRNKYMIQKLVPSFGFGERGNQSNIFIRPSNGYKTFAGQVISIEQLEKEIDILMKSYGGVDPETLILLSKQQEINEEYRFIVVDGNVITGSLYMDNYNRKTLKPYYDKPVDEMSEAFKFAKLVANVHQPDKAFTIDICSVDYGDYKLFKILEINSFNCASMYGAEYEKIVNSINQLAINQYNDIWE